MDVYYLLMVALKLGLRMSKLSALDDKVFANF